METESRKETSLNLSYLVATPKRKPIPWSWILAGCILASFVLTAIWLVSNTKRETVYVYQVQQGETLRILAGRFYDNPRKWKKIFLANREKLSKDNYIQPGDKIRIPFDEEEKKEYFARLNQPPAAK